MNENQLAPKRATPHCRYCDSTNVTLDAIAQWDDDTQQWIIAGTLDCGDCNDCGEEMSYFIWKENE